MRKGRDRRGEKEGKEKAVGVEKSRSHPRQASTADDDGGARRAIKADDLWRGG